MDVKDSQVAKEIYYHGLGPGVRDPSSFIEIVAVVCGHWRLSLGW